MEYDFNLVCYGFFKVPNVATILKVFLSITNDYFLTLSFKKKKPSSIITWNYETPKCAFTLILKKIDYSINVWLNSKARTTWLDAPIF